MSFPLIMWYILQWFFVLVVLAGLILLCFWMYTGLRAKVPFVPVPNSILPYIHKALGIKEGSVVYDLGCGDARVVLYSAVAAPGASYVGIENGPFPVFLARVMVWWKKKFYKNLHVQILNKDFFTQDLSDATHVFTYLYPNIMDDLLPKFDKELKPGTRLVSVTFKFTNKRPTAEIDLDRNGKYQIAKKMYIYEF